ncbi:diguanylate cyclase [Altererythrobacter indicus]|uniref:diguanylate cyclase n=1 Tax=Altericroceibacterium indicum TaxID=374177 RepID=A0A845A8E2_9SPHN|nr:diguanylate cyclase [Altericroceibacterium indicum]MXP25291.1 diguanylate cyclase [Altericroceibacterium indicum]
MKLRGKIGRFSATLRRHAKTSPQEEGASGSLVSHIILRMVVISLLGAFAMAAIAFVFLYRQAERQELENLRDYVGERGSAESQLFAHAQHDVKLFRRAYLSAYADNDPRPVINFDRYYLSMPDGTVRLRPEFYYGYRDQDGLLHSGTTGFVGKEALPLNDDLKRRLVLAYRLVDEFSPAWMNDFTNLHVTLPEGALIAHWPAIPWGLEADSSLELTTRPVITTTQKANDPDRHPIWAGIYFDKSLKDWMGSYMLPVDAPNGRQLASINVDIALGELVRLITRKSADGSYLMILTRDGKVIAHPDHMEELSESSGETGVTDLGDADLISIYSQLKRSHVPQDGSPVIVDDPEVGAYLGVTELNDGGWWLVQVYPHTIVSGDVNRASYVLLLLLIGLAGLLIFAFAIVLKRNIARPLKALKQACEMISLGEYKAVGAGNAAMPEQRRDEIGLLSRSFRHMAKQIDYASEELEQAVISRTSDLRKANQKLNELSFRDALTHAYNRRAFDRDLAKAAKDGGTVVLALFDVDHFKLYNDTYGHAAGDEALRRVVSILQIAMPDARIYRYGGEEIAALIYRQTIAEGEAALSNAASAVAQVAIPHRSCRLGFITISGGVVPLAFFEGDGDAALKAVDRALYEAKSTGRNRMIKGRVRKVKARLGQTLGGE